MHNVTSYSYVSVTKCLISSNLLIVEEQKENDENEDDQ